VLAPEQFDRLYSYSRLTQRRSVPGEYEQSSSKNKNPSFGSPAKKLP
jgi:hypothetical protein